MSEVLTALSGSRDPRELARFLLSPEGREFNCFPLSFAQERLWFLEQLEPGAAYTIPAAIRLSGRLDAAALEGALAEMLARHESLLTAFFELAGTPIQHIQPDATLDCPVVDLSGLERSCGNEAALALVREESRRPFDLSRPPLLRVRLLRLGEREHLLFMVMHHIVSDGWSVGVLVRELSALYAACAAGRPSPLPELPVQYVDFAVWQREWFSGEERERQLDYWRGALSGLTPELPLPYDHPRTGASTGRGAEVALLLPADLAAAVQALGRRSGATLFITLLAALQAVLHRYTGEVDLTVGTPIANRNQVETEGLIGFFVNTLVLRGDLAGDPRFGDLLARVRKVALAAFDHQDTPFEAVVEAVNPQRQVGHTPLFQVLFVLQNVPQSELRLPELTLALERLPSENAIFDLSLVVTEIRGGGLRLDLEYSTDLFEAPTVLRLAHHFETLLEGAVAAPELRLSELPLQPAWERHQVLWEWNDTLGREHHGLTLHGLFEHQAALRGEAEAVVCGERSLTYAGLDERANRLARYLRRRGVGPGVRVGLCVERSLEMAVGILGVLKAGAAYVPLDPSYPPERLEFMVADSLGGERGPVMLSLERLAGRLPRFDGEPVLLDRDWTAIAEESAAAPEWKVDEEDLAVLIYTSGSTGRPKGVMIPHRSLANYSLSFSRRVGLSAADRVMQFAALSFDTASEEIYPTWTLGATLVLRPQELFASIADFERFLVHHRITFVDLPSSYWHEWTADLARDGRPLPPSLRRIAVGSEITLTEKLRTWRELFGPQVTVLNGYGPTEVTVAPVIWAPDLSQPVRGPHVMLIGRPIENYRVYLLDRGLRPVPLGVLGEVLLGGRGVTRGYLGRPDLTAERFVPNPYPPPDRPGERLYRTGDLARYLGDGILEYVGRADEQIKIRGFRIEPGEIEAALLEHPGIAEAVVVAREAPSGGPRLVAYFVADGPPPAGEELRALLRQSLPEHMVPAVYVPLEAMPLNPNGKLDRRALPAPEQAGAGEKQGATGLRGPVEELLAQVWSGILGASRVGPEDNFFELGGHSLLGMQVVSRVREALGVELAVRTLFEAPTLRELAERIEALQGGARPQEPPIRPVPREGVLPLSFAQQRLWFLDQLQPGSAMYNVPIAVRLRGDLDVAAFAASLAKVVRRHEPLRTTFRAVGGEPAQVISPPFQPPLPVIDLRGLAAEAEVARLAQEEARRPFDLAAGPVLRATLIRLGERDHALLLTLHHIVSDGWSMGVFVRELATLYGAFREGRPSGLPELPVQYADFAVWQRAWLSGEVLATQLAYWRRQLAGGPSALDLPTDRPRPAVATSRGRRMPVSLPPDAVDRLQAFCRREGSTLYMTLLAALSALFSRYTGREDVRVGSPVANRSRVETEPLIGFFVNTLVLRTDLSGGPGFREFLGRVRETTLEAYSHQDLPFDRLVQELVPERDLAQSPLFQAMLVLENAPQAVVSVDLEMAPLEAPLGIAKFDLTLSFEEADGELVGFWEFNLDLFDPARIARMSGHFLSLLTEATADPGRRIQDLALMDEAERHQVLLGWNDTSRRVVTETLHGLFTVQARRTPEAPALRFEGEEMTFGELDRRSNQLARFLGDHGVGPDVLVGLCMERSLELMVGVLGILKAGGGYVPLDPGYPADRLAYMLEDSGAPVMLGQERLLDRMPESEALRMLVDADWDRIAAYGDEPLPELADTDDLACVLYTSGSTGRPKGVMDSHRCVINQLQWLQSTYRLDGTDRVLQKTPISWDVSQWELFWPLMSGACMVLAVPGGHQDPRYLSRTIAEEKITTVHFVPSMLRIFLESESAESCASLRRVVSSGEALGLDLEEKFYSAFAIDLNNMYGPGESARTTLWRCERGNTRTIAPIGRPTHDTQVYVLDRRLEPAPIGVAGEIWVASQSMARGYHLRPDLTAEKFLPNPFGAFGTRLYRTGDLGRTLPDGTLEFLGRIDHQVKIRGVRIELGEIEHALGQLPGVKEAVVVARPVGAGEKRLAAYLVPEGGVESLAVEELRQNLRSQVPEYMVPESWVVLPALPLAPNGKADRDRLPEPQWVTRRSGYVAPRTPVEGLLATAWAEVLELERVGAEDNFFALGGHSLLATRLASRLRGLFGTEVPLRTLFERPVLAELATAISELLRHGQSPAAPPLVPVPRTAPLPLSFAQQRLWFLERLQPGSSAYNIPNALRVKGELRPELWDGALSEIVRRHESLRTTFAWRDGDPVQAIGKSAPVVSAIRDLRPLEPAARQAEARRLALEEAEEPFDLERGPMLRSRLLRLADDEWLLLLTLHHIASDGWSTGILIRELRELYTAFSEERPARLPELPVQYSDFAVWQRGWLQGEVLEREVAHWREALAGAPPALELPTDHPRPALQSFRGGYETLEIDPAVSRSFSELAPREGVTLFMAVLGALQVLLSRYSGFLDFNVGSPISGRNRLEIEGLIGFFVNTLVLRADLSGEPDFRELLGRVRSRVLDAYTHQEVPFELLVDDLAPQRDLSRSPLFQVLLVMQHASPSGLALPGVDLEPSSLESRTAKFDLTLNVVEEEGRLFAGLEYAADLFEAATARRLLRHFAALLGAIAADPRRPVGSLPWLTPAERQQLLVEWNDHGGGRHEPAWLHELFEAQVRRTPEATALVWGETRLSFQELNRQANQLAHHLRRLGVGPESRVGVSLERTPEMIVSLLATLKAGGAYVPLDPTYPAQRLAWILEDAGIEVLLTRSPQRERLPGFGGWAFCFDVDAHLLTGEPEVDPAGWRFERQLAYVLYTSGSTGRPKGVLLEHRTAVAMLDWAAARFTPEETSGVLGSTSINFDVSVFEIFHPLLRGGRLILAENALALPELPAAGEVTLVAAVPSAVAELVRGGGIPPSVQVVNLGGEPVPRPLADDLNRISTIRKVYNLYGPTEDTTYSTWALLEAGETGAPSIGRPISGSQLYVVDALFQPVPLGAVGEIVLGGSGLSRGYLGRPDLTAARFVPDPLGSEPGGRLYRTSDLGKFLPDGRVAYLGRIDHQVKIRGFRVELGEIEGVLREHPEVADGVVVARESAGGARLVAYVVLAAGGAEVERLRQHVAERLPVYMVPSAFVLLEALPHTPNGKVDRAALPEPDLAGREAGYVAPRTPVEELIAGVWAEVLGLPRIGVEDNFFELGGHSLLATRVMVRLRDALGMDLPLRRLFEAPTVAGLALQAGSSWAEGLEMPPLHRRAEARPRLSFAQERLWFLEQLQPESAAYNMPAALKLEGAPRIAVLRAALGEIVRRHEVLRTTFAQRGGEPVQVIHPAAPLPLPVIDLAALPTDVRDETARRLSAGESRRPFDLAAGPVIRASLLRLAAAEHVLLLTLHHVVSDGWSLGLLVDEASTLYQAFLEGRPSPLPELAVQYGDFAVWQREWLRGRALERQLAWWREHLKGAPGVLDLPADRPRPALRSSRGGEVPIEIPPRVARELAALGRGRGATPFMLYLAAFQALLGRLAGREDVVVGTPIAGRVRAELEPLIGLFLNTLALRGNLWGDPDFGEQLARVREAALGAYAHQDLPFERLVDELAPERNLTHAPVFQVLFVFHNAPRGRLDLPGLVWSPLENPGGTAKFDLTLTLQEAGDGLVGGLGFHRDLFDEATVRRWVGHLGVLLEGIAREPEQRLSERALMSASERHQVVLAWNDTARGVVEETLHGLFVAQARLTPEAPALRFEGEEMTFGALDRRSNQLARFLGDHGVGPDVLVGLCMERSLELMVGVLGILKAGGGYVPLDPGYPADRLAYMLEDSGAPVLLGQERLLDRMPESEALRVLVDADWERIAAYGDDPLPELADTDDLACVLYTSGSTGRPKGVMDSHRCVINQLRWLQSTYRLDGTDRVLQKTPISWDVSQWELFWPLMSGACMVLAVPGGHQDPRYLASTISKEKITTVHFVPSMLRIFLESESAESCASLRRVVSSGEALGLDLEEKFFASFTVDLNNMYGPGESARTTLWRCERGNARAIAPIGRPTHDTQVYVLDRRLEPVPIGVAGEIWVASQSMARGYHLRPDLTAEKFLPNPFGAYGTRLYRTGDLGRTLPDGTLEFLGRIDHQVKIRGVRIELGEIETALGQHPKVSDAVVMARAAGSGEKRLAAYVVPEEGPDSVNVEELRDYLRTQLPDYMVPESWVMLEAMPLAPNGKADRERLPEPQWVAWQHDYVAPRTLEEELLAATWSELLGVERVGARDSFFELGGNSLLATQVASRVRSVFAVEMPLRTVFERPVLSELAAAVAELRRRGSSPIAPPLVPLPRTGPLPLSFSQERLWFLHQLDPASAVYNIPAAVRLTGRLDAAALKASLGEIVRRHEPLRTSFTLDGQQPLQVVEPPPPPALPVVDLAGLPPAAREVRLLALALEEAGRPFDLRIAPLVRMALLRLAPQEHVLLLTVHHIAADGWSMGLFVQELAALYAALSSGLPSPLAELPVQYADFALWQRDWLTGEVLAAQLDYWRRQLAGAPALLELPADRPRRAVQRFRGGQEVSELPAEELARLHALATHQGATLFMVLLAGFDALVSRYTGQRDLVVGTPIAGRTHRETEGLIGLFLNTLALRVGLAGDPGFGEILERVRGVMLDAYTHQDLPFERLVDHLALERSLSYTPVFQALLVLQNTPSREVALADLTLTPVEAANDSVKFDLVLSASKVGGRLRLHWSYNRDLFDAGRIAHLARHFETLLAGAAADPGRRLSDLPLLTSTERLELLSWNQTAADFSLETCLHELVEAQVERTPEATAVVFAGQEVSYREVNRRANLLAHELRSLGAGPEILVGVAVERSLELVVGLLAVLKAGAAYVPIDPSYPADRLAFLLADSRVPVLLTQERLLVGISPVLPAGTQVLYLDAPAQGSPVAWLENPRSGARPDNLAYVIYTSGSTGRPKGAMNTHRGIVNRLLWMQEAYGLTADDRVLQKTPASFDVSVWEFFWPLITGASLVVARPGGHQDPGYLVRLIAGQRVTTAHFVPSMLQVFLESPDLSECGSLRRVIASGEALSFELQERCHSRLAAPLHNLYGPTEAAVDVTAWACERQSARPVVPIGRPVANTRIHLLDAAFHPVPAGIPGELFIGGVQLARGYHGRPDLTAERFVPDPLGTEAGERLYRTGDLARYLPEGAIEYLGRIDHQVKLRGIRIELGEIESALRAQPAVREAVVVAREEASGQAVRDLQLVAYVVAEEGDRKPTVAELRGGLGALLPEHMVPSSWVFLPALPLNPNGKIDRRALPAPEPAEREDGGYQAPRNGLEELLADLWSASLRQPRVGIHDSFFELGGNSLGGSILIYRLQQELDETVQVAALFEAPTVASMAVYLEKEHAAAVARRWGPGDQVPEGPAPGPGDRPSPLVRMQSGEGRPPLFLVHPVGGNVLCYAALARELGTDRPVYGLQSVGLFEDQEPQESLPEMASTYLREVLAVQPEGPYLIGGWSLGGDLAYEMARQLEREGAGVSLVLIDCRAPRDGAPEEPVDEVDMLVALVRDLTALGGRPAEISGWRLRSLDPAARLDLALSELEQSGAVPPEMGRARFERLWRVFRANLEAMRLYRPATALSMSKAVLFRAGRRQAEGDGSLGWREKVGGGLAVEEIAGDHYSLLQPPTVAELTRRLKSHWKNMDAVRTEHRVEET